MLHWSRGLTSKKRKAFTKRCSKDSLNCKLRLLPSASESTGKEESCSTDLGNDPDHQEDIGLVFHNAGKEECAWNSRDPSGHLLLLPSPRNAAAAKSFQSCLTPCDPRDDSPPGSAVPGILQARTLEWVAISFSNAWRSVENQDNSIPVGLVMAHSL